VLVPWVVPKLVPATTQEIPVGPELGVRLVIVGPALAPTVKITLALLIPVLLETTTGPVDAPTGHLAMR
jgi:hypothetical protein